VIQRDCHGDQHVEVEVFHVGRKIIDAGMGDGGWRRSDVGKEENYRVPAQ
jgi:hypothetical protein